MKTAHIFVIGFVQGVGFRRFIRSKAKLLKLTGWVQNMPDGRVEVVAQGPEASIKELIKIAEKGNWLSSIKGVVVDWEESQEKFDDFELRF